MVGVPAGWASESAVIQANLRNENWAKHYVVGLVDEAIARFAIGSDNAGLAIGPEPATGDVASEVNALDCRAVQVG